ncbi:3-oxoacyl-acyl-carrier-protein reductase [Aphelenchoides avenae]|nr:3-oxoacyl-acyl-carrier-protein reductase [Aphelenchus avenae]
MVRFSGKAVIITGSSAGIGRQAAIEFAKEGAMVTIHGRDKGRIEETKKQLHAAGIPDNRFVVVEGNIEDEKTQRQLIDKTIDRFGRIDVLVNNVAIMKPTDITLEAMSESMDAYDYIFAVNVRSIVTLTHLAAPHLEKTKGNIINVGSFISKQATTFFTYLAMAKAALDHWSIDAALKYAPKGVRVNTVSPGLIRTDFFARQGITGDAFTKFEGQLSQKTLLKRFGTPHEVSAMILTLASDEASYVTGATLAVDGGILINSG